MFLKLIKQIKLEKDVSYDDIVNCIKKTYSRNEDYNKIIEWTDESLVM